MGGQGHCDEVVRVENLWVPLEQVLDSYRLDVMHQNLALDWPPIDAEVETVVPQDDLASNALPFVGLVEHLVEVSMPAKR